MINMGVQIPHDLLTGVVKLGHMEVLFLAFCSASILVTIAARLIYIPTSSLEEFSSPTLSPVFDVTCFLDEFGELCC